MDLLNEFSFILLYIAEQKKVLWLQLIFKNPTTVMTPYSSLTKLIRDAL